MDYYNIETSRDVNVEKLWITLC